MAQVFVSYKHEAKSQSFVEKLEKRLKAEGFEVWIDWKIPHGSYWHQEIDNGIKASIALALILTEESQKSAYVIYEWSFALGLGIPVIPILIDSIELTNLHPRLQLLQFAKLINARSGNQKEWDKLIKSIRKTEKDISQNVDIVPFVKQAIQDLDSGKEKDAETALDRLTKSNHPSAIEAIEAATQHHVDYVRIYAAIKLAEQTNYQNEKALSGLAEGVTNHGNYHQKAYEYLLKYQAIDIFQKILNEASWSEARALAAKGLGVLRAKQAVPALIEALQDEADKVAAFAAEALGLIGDITAIPSLINYVRRKPAPQFTAITALGKLHAVDSVPILIQLLPKVEHFTQSAIEKAILEIGNAASPYLQQVLQDSDKLNPAEYEIIVAKTIQLLAQLKDENSIELIAGKLLDNNWSIKIAAAKALGTLGDKSKVELLWGFVSNENEDIRFASLSSIEKLAPDNLNDYFIQALDSRYSEIRRYAADRIGRLNIKEALPKLKTIQDSDEVVQRYVTIAINLIENAE